MNKMRSFYNKYVIFMGVLTFLAMGALFSSILGWFMGGMIALGFSSFIGLLIWHFLKTSQPLPLPPMHTTQDELNLSLRESMKRLEINWVQIAFVHLLILIFININLFWMTPEFYLKMYIPVNLFYIFLSFIASWIKSSHLRDAKKLIGFKERKLVLNSAEIIIPIELLNEVAIHKAIKNQQTEIRIDWNDMESCEVFNKVGGSRPQILIRFNKKHEYADFLGQISIMRYPELDLHLKVVQKFIFQYTQQREMK